MRKSFCHVRQVLLCGLVVAMVGGNWKRVAQAQDALVIPQQRLITVTGDADVKVVPDEVLLTLGLETSDPDIARAKLLNNERVKGVLAIAKEFKIEPKYVQVDFISIDPSYWRSKNNFTVRRTLVVTIKDVSKFEALLTRMVQNNRANYVHGIQFRTTELRKYRDQARALAIKAAREKAIDLATALGVTVGKPYAIREEGSNWWSWYNPYWGGNYGSYAQNAQVNAQVSLNDNSMGGSSNSTFAPGQIAINAKITVSFELQ